MFTLQQKRGREKIKIGCQTSNFNFLSVIRYPQVPTGRRLPPRLSSPHIVQLPLSSPLAFPKFLFISCAKFLQKNIFLHDTIAFLVISSGFHLLHPMCLIKALVYIDIAPTLRETLLPAIQTMLFFTLIHCLDIGYIVPSIRKGFSNRTWSHFVFKEYKRRKNKVTTHLSQHSEPQAPVQVSERN